MRFKISKRDGLCRHGRFAIEIVRFSGSTDAAFAGLVGEVPGVEKDGMFLVREWH